MRVRRTLMFVNGYQRDKLEQAIASNVDCVVLELEDLSRYVVRDAKGNPVKEWYAIASYLEQMGGEMDEQYSQPDGRKVVYSSLNPVKLLKNANKFTVLLLAAVLLLVGVLVAVCRFVCRRKKRK